jgi:hypothetical protein
MLFSLEALSSILLTREDIIEGITLIEEANTTLKLREGLI